MLGHDPSASTSENYRRFAALEAHGTSPVYEAICNGISADPELLAFLGGLAPRCRQPNLLLGVVKYAFGEQATYEAFRETVLSHRDRVAELLATRRTQTNEPARCAAMLPILASLPGPLALLEVGASAGLCLLPDRYGYRYGDHVVGEGPPVIDCRLVGDVTPPLPTTLPEVVWRKGIDLEPLDVRDPDHVRWLEALVWPGQTARERNLRESLALAREDPPEIVEGDLTELLEDVAADAPPDATLVVFHTAVLALPDGRATRRRRASRRGAGRDVDRQRGTRASWASRRVRGRSWSAGTSPWWSTGGMKWPAWVPHGDWLKWEKQCTAR